VDVSEALIVTGSPMVRLLSRMNRMFGWSLPPTGVKNTSVSSAHATGALRPAAHARAAQTADNEDLRSVLMEYLKGRFGLALACMDIACVPQVPPGPMM
jgi:hypothetical protein